MGGSKNEYEVVDYNDLADIKIFLVCLSYRNPHIHREFELCRVLSGSVRVSSQHETYDFGPGDLFLFNPHQVHEIHARGESATERDAEILSLQVSSRWCERFFPKMAYVEFAPVDLGTQLDGKTSAKLKEEMRKLAIAYFTKERGYEFICISRVAEIFHLLMTGAEWHLLSDKERSARIARSDRVNRIIEYVESRVTEKILLSEIAKREGLTLPYLSHFFRDNLNMSFQRFVTLLRFDEARHLVELTDLPITDISFTCGFSDYRYLNRIYMEKIGCTPSEYRKSRRETDLLTVSGAAGKNADLSNRDDRHAKQRFYSNEKSLSVLASCDENNGQ